MDLFFFFFLITAMGLIMEQEGRNLPKHASAQHREKRCSCENLKDKECVYFCHIGIVWVNTPSQVIPYGVGSLQMRQRRDVGRCLCRKKSDTECLMFCSLWYSEGENASDLGYSARKSKKRYKVTVKQKKHNQKV